MHCLYAHRSKTDVSALKAARKGALNAVFGIAGLVGAVLMVASSIALDLAATTGQAGWSGIMLSCLAFSFGGLIFIQASVHLKPSNNRLRSRGRTD